ncbi:hypothetical protein COU95_00380 [Candidatus Shapirobacteria bacterium CG10_big_fil_rev_8_21_14_0_10_40_9]|uniref:Glycosyl transferase family 28 C-terminal domain-containing protein n=1 Tax=Candidatus Shapirobacteria bacterium CG10_big_fil_rev_8_21_14_0_10_40_9 TaxID=1974888 RepID=A0A2M8L4C8_9BACT|nr:MAG: hypothetical protein COU95_00380 [Candidatus Shapirobacteria bacterium CG10_big_fil_rev_8_21_14_0_10_40_9]
MPFDKMISYLKKARVVVTHGGPATIFLALKYGQNQPLVVPRTKKYNEHVDNHELFFARFLKEKGEIGAIFPEEDLPSKINEYFRQPVGSKSKKKSFVPNEVINRLIDYTASLR